MKLPSAPFGLGREARVDLRQRGDVGQPPGLGRVGEEGVGEQDHRRAVLRPRSAPPRSRRRSTPPGVQAATTGSGDSPWRPYSASSRSACLGLRGHARSRARRAARRRSPAAARASRARPIVSAFRSMPGPLVAVTPRLPAEGGAERHVGGGDLVLGLNRAHAEPLVARQLVEQLGRGRDRVAGEEQPQPAAARWRRSARAPSRWCRSRCGRCRAGRAPARPRSARPAARPSRRSCSRRGRRPGWRRGSAACPANFFSIQSTVTLGRAAVHPRHAARARRGSCALRRRAAVMPSMPSVARTVMRRHRHAEDLVVVERAVLERVRLVARLAQVVLRRRRPR